ncbi:hypothetical protein [Aquamicrobium defluvii]|uniref:Uncharacterized protein n=1 Tax=Aquamicrobium defluvii TaxID=69279 RepID=A0A4R6YF17_9HYPH|nr:hypothetical protein [Aquamicrobium defluvii]TDR34707.1 hypothetical protein DES43_113138 [Aquamicrobium defluvii]
MKPKMAQQISFYLCDHCAAVHIAFHRNGKIFAEAIPDDIAAVAEDLDRAIVESVERRLGPSPAAH